MSDKSNIPGKNEVAIDPQEAASVSERIDSLRKKAEQGEIGDEFLEGVAGGCHTDGVTHTDGAHTDGTTHTDCASEIT